MNIPNLRYYTPPEFQHHRTLTADLCVFGGNSGGIIAALAAKRRGLSVLLLEPGYHLGGLSAGGLSLTDIGNKRAIGGMSREFYERVGRHYGEQTHWRFEPHIASQVYEAWLNEEGIPCWFESFLSRIEMQEGRIKKLFTENGLTVEAHIFIDATYEGDLMARAGVSYTVGREDNSQYGETYNGSQVHPTHQFTLPVDPYRTEGEPLSGLLPGIEDATHVTGQGDHRVQAYNFRLCLTQKESNRIPFSEPAGYNPADYELLARYCRAGFVPGFNKFDPIAGDKVDMNNHGAVSSDFIGQNFAFPEAGYREREVIFQRHVDWILGLLWFWSADASIPLEFKNRIRTWGWCRDEFVQTSGFSHALYVREARRMVSDYVMTEANCVGAARINDCVGLAAYTMDSHNCRRIVVDGHVKNEGDVQVPPGPPYPIAYRSLIPRRGECRNLLVPFCLSASHIAFGSIRMEPVFMVLAESCVEAAGIALRDRCDVQDVPYPNLEERLRGAGQVLDPVPTAKSRQSGE